MMQALKVVGVGGSMASTSSSLAALTIALEGAAEAGAETRLFDIRSLNLPIFNPELPHVPDEARRFCDAVYTADGLVWSTPMYHGAMSGAFKNAIDWLQLLSDRDPPYLTDKIIGLISTAGGVQGLQAINSMEFVVRALRGWAVPLVMPISKAWQAFNDVGQPRDPQLGEQIKQLGREVVRASRQFAAEGYCDYSVPVPARVE